MLVNIQFLWDDEKLKRIIRILIFITVGSATIGFFYGLTLPSTHPFRNFLIILPPSLPLGVIAINFIPKLSLGWKGLLMLLWGQLVITSYMALSGGFESIAQFAPYVVLILTAFQLGPTPSLVMLISSVLMFIGVLIWIIFTSSNSLVVYQDFLLYVGIFVVIGFIVRKAGQELSLQYEARKKLEEMDDLKNQFISLTSHYLRTPLSIIKMATGGGRDVDIKKVNDAVIQLENLTENLLTISSLEKGQVKINTKQKNVSELLEEIINKFQPEALRHKVTLYLNIPKSIPPLEVDGSKLKIALANLVDNGIKFNNPGGKVEVSAEMEGKNLSVKVADNGIGIEEEKITTLFKPFSKGGMDEVLQFTHPGAGLGLYLTKLIIEAHKGKIEVHSEAGKGAVFIVTLPTK